MNKRTILNLLKYALAASVMTWVVWTNWGDSRGIVGKIVVEGVPSRGKIHGQVMAFDPGHSITVQPKEGGAVELALKPGTKTALVHADDTPLGPEERLTPGQVVTIAEVSRGLSYVWRRHVIEGQPVNKGYFAIAMVFAVAALFITFLRWHILVRAVDIPFRLIDSLRLGFIGFFFSAFLPGSVGGDAVKAWFLARGHNRRTVAVATVLMDRAIALWALIWFVALLGGAFWVGGLLEGEGSDACKGIVRVAGAIVAISLTVWLLLGLLPNARAERFAERLAGVPRVGHVAAELWRAVWIYRCRQASVFAVLALSWVGHVGFVLLFYFAALTLWDPESGQELPTLTQHVLIVPIGMVISALPLFPGGAGVGELGFGKLYDWLGCSEASGVLGSLVQRVINWMIGLMSYVAYRRLRQQTPFEETIPKPESMDQPEPVQA